MENNNQRNNFQDQKKKPFLTMRDYQSQQACVVIGLLNLNYEIEFERPFKSSSKSLQFIRAIKLFREGTEINVKERTDERVNKLVEKDISDGVNTKTVQRRKDVYKVVEHIHVLIDLVQSDGVEIEIKKDKRTEAQDRMTIKKIKFDGFEIDKEGIEKKGTEIHKLLLNKVVGLKITGTTVLTKGDTEIMAILLE